MRDSSKRGEGDGTGRAARACLRLKVFPKASRNALIDCQEGFYRLRLAAAPVEGQANAALKVFMARCLGVPKTSIRILQGERSRIKTLEIIGVSQEKAEKLLGRILGG